MFKLAFLASTVLAISISALTVQPAFAGGSKVSTNKRPDGGTSQTATTRRGTVCTVFSKQGAPLCTRTYSTTNHKVAIKKCMRIRC